MFDDFACDARRVRRFFLVHCLVYSSALHCYSQAPPTFAEALQRHHVELSEVSLIQALHSPDKEVRGLAAAELADLKFTWALPEILHAAERENDAQTQVNLASAATWLGSDQGLHMLTGICKNSTVSALVRMQAARSVFDRHCFPSLVEMMRPTAETDVRIVALELASQIKPRTAQETQAVLASALDALQDRDLRIRLQACEALRWLNDPRAIQPLRTAINLEQEEAVRQQMKSSLGYLEKEHSKRSGS